jgi:pimeloyl-ACP methyl ester carboxylesterase
MSEGKYANVNGLKLYYEMHGTGRPLVLLHGGLGGIGMLAHVLPMLAETHEVIAVELEGHGRTALLDRALSFEQMADDLAALIQQLGVDKADLTGYSLGGAVALNAASRHPQAVRKLVLVSAPFKSDAWYPEVRAGMKALNAEAAKAMAGSPPHQAYIGVAPRPEDWPELVTRTGQLVGQDYDWSQAVAALKAPTMIVFGDADSIRPAHAVEFFELLGGGKADAGWDGSNMPSSRLAILPGTTHYNSFVSPMLVPMITSFLDAPMPDAATRSSAARR